MRTRVMIFLFLCSFAGVLNADTGSDNSLPKIEILKQKRIKKPKPQGKWK